VKKPLIGLTMDQSPATDPRPFSVGAHIYFLNSLYVRYLEKSDGLPLVIPTLHDPQRIPSLIDRLDGLLLTGGDDVFAQTYGEETIAGDWRIDPPRTFMEIALIKEARRQGKPVFAICRGCQMLNVAMGGTLYQDIPQQVKNAEQHRSPDKPRWNYHTVTIENGSRLAAILGETTLSVTTSHHQAIKDLAPEVAITARASDGIIEAVEDPTAAFFLGVQWHAEAMQDDRSSLALLNAFLDHCQPSR